MNTGQLAVFVISCLIDVDMSCKNMSLPPCRNPNSALNMSQICEFHLARHSSLGNLLCITFRKLSSILVFFV